MRLNSHLYNLYLRLLQRAKYWPVTADDNRETLQSVLMGVKHLLMPLAVGVLVVYVYHEDESVDPGQLTCEAPGALQMRDKVMVVTGGCRGVGYHTALELARRGARLVLGCRDSTAGRAARERIVAATGSQRISVIGLDVARMKHVSTFVYYIKQKFDRVDVLINNAATSGNQERRETTEGLEEVMATNYLGPRHLTQSLAPLMPPDGVVINLVERSEKVPGPPDVTDINSSAQYDPATVYLQSKQLLHLMTREMSSRLAPSVYSVQPCPVWSGLHSVLPHQLTGLLSWSLGPLLGSNPAREAARTVVWLAGGGAGGRHSGRAWHSCHLEEEDSLEVPHQLRETSDALIQRALSS